MNIPQHPDLEVLYDGNYWWAYHRASGIEMQIHDTTANMDKPFIASLRRPRKLIWEIKQLETVDAAFQYLIGCLPQNDTIGEPLPFDEGA